jgi:hypothetical protein
MNKADIINMIVSGIIGGAIADISVRKYFYPKYLKYLKKREEKKKKESAQKD